MRLKNVRVVWLSLTLLAVLSVCGLAQWRRPGAWGYPGLDLTDEQLAKIQQVRLAFLEKVMPLQIRWEKAQLNLDSLTMKRGDQKELEAAHQALEGLEIELEKAWQAHRDEMRNLLNEEQRVFFDRYGGLGMGLGWGANPEWGMRPGWGQDYGRGYGLGMRFGYRPGWGRAMGPWNARGWGRGLGRGYFCPWFRGR
jgi:hypothetical protein